MLSRKHPRNNSIIAEPFVSAAIEKGNTHFITKTTDDLVNNPIIITFTAPPLGKNIHLSASMWASGAAYSHSVEDPDSITGGTALPIISRNRITSFASCITDMTQDATVVVGSGTTINEAYFGDKRISGGIANANKWILGDSHTYAIMITTSSPSVAATVQFDWYECPCDDTCPT